jgi:hypothetical protein
MENLHVALLVGAAMCCWSAPLAPKSGNQALLVLGAMCQRAFVGGKF